MRVLLVSTYELGHQPLHLASPAARLLAERHEVRCLDLSIEEWDASAFAWADKVAFSVPMHTAMRLALAAVIRLRRQRPDLPIALYGLYAAIGADHSVDQHDELRIVGEYEDELAAWAAPSGHEDRAIRLDVGRKGFPVPARHLLPGLENYARLEIEGETRLVGYVEASHGCRHRCRHCPIPAVYDGRYRVTGLETVLADIEQLTAVGAQHITFGDPDFLNAPRYARDVLNEVTRTFPGLTYDLTVKVEHILEEASIWESLADLGVVFVVSAFETTNDTILNLLDKGHTAEDMSQAVKTLSQAGIDVRPSWMPFTPWTERADLPEIFRFLAEHQLLESTDPVQLAIRLLVPEGSLLLSLPGISDLLDGYDSLLLTHTWNSPDPAIDDLQQQLSALAEQGSQDSWATLMKMWTLVSPGVSTPASSGRSAPRLTEAWFCCAEPTSNQLMTVGRESP
ncbi:MAG TPA: CUAEP/CCAEP-tail radical SAM protein [Acidimicrobiia bacterium]|nr:CUAEP/CCAEP-tail radical SAM protein [Acidimicrobiia bacterium]